MLASLFGGSSERFSWLCTNFSSSSLDDLIDLVLANNADFSAQVPVSAVVPADSEATTSTPEQQPESSALPSQVIPPMLKKKSEKVAEIMGGSAEDYVNVILNMPSKISVDEILIKLMEEKELKKQQ